MGRPKKEVKKFFVIKDSREKENFGWTFPESAICAGTVIETLKTGDYTLKGFEHIFTIDRKRNTGELAGNIFEDRFVRELERMKLLRHAWVVCEFWFEDVCLFPANSGIPKSKWPELRVTNKLLLKKIIEFQLDYNVHFVFAGTKSQDFAASVFRRMIERYNEEASTTTNQ